ncbi:MAG: nitrate reductase [Bacteroidetes bacterium]|nr:MAG: nitrate reductase [Bacteroidota bacterium]
MFTFKNPRDPQNLAITKILKQWTIELLQLSENSVVMVTESQCLDENCPDMETVIAIFEEKQETRSFRIRRPLIFVRKFHLEEVFNNEKIDWADASDIFLF